MCCVNVLVEFALYVVGVACRRIASTSDFVRGLHCIYCAILNYCTVARQRDHRAAQFRVKCHFPCVAVRLLLHVTASGCSGHLLKFFFARTKFYATCPCTWRPCMCHRLTGFPATPFGSHTLDSLAMITGGGAQDLHARPRLLLVWKIDA